MKKNIALSALAAASLSVASMAGAAEVNIIGASAQFDFIDANAVAFVGKYCATVPATPRILTYKTSNGNTVKNAIVYGELCGTSHGKLAIPGATSDTTLTFRYVSLGSGEGIQAAAQAAPLDSDLNAGCSTSQRLFAKTTTAASATIATGVIGDYQAATVCATPNIGMSDVAWNNFDQAYTNEFMDPNGINTVAPLPTFSAPTYGANGTVAVPFAFYVNPGVTATHCVSSVNTADNSPVAGFKLGQGPHTGGLCTSTNLDQCATGSVCETVASTIDNLSRLQANLLYSGAILNWNQLGPYFTSNDVKLCLRKAGSGTHAAFDKTVMRAAGTSLWGAPYTPYEVDAATGPLYGYPETQFNGSSTDEKNCINTSGAIGYMDADTSNAASYVKVKYNGIPASRSAVRNGAYEFYTVGQMYADASGLAQAVVAHVQDPANIPGASTNTGKALYWATLGEMVFVRGLDTSYPTKK